MASKPGKSTKYSSGLAGAVKIVVQTFLQEKHYQDLHVHLSDQWSHCHSLSAAVRLMEAHGVYITATEEANLAKLPEESMIEVLVTKMPQQSREQFEHFFLQLSLIASTTTRLRHALETGNSHAVEEVLEAAEDTGILGYILKMAVAQAGIEAKAHEEELDKYMTVMTDKMDPLMECQAKALSVQKALSAAKSELGIGQAEAKEKSKNVLMNIVGGKTEAFRNAVFVEWASCVKREKKMREVREEYEEEIKAAQGRLNDYIEKQLGIMRNMLNSQSAEGLKVLMTECFHAFVAQVEDKKREIEKAKEMEALEKSIKDFGAEQSAKSKKVLSRMNAGSEQGLLALTFAAWVQFHEDYKKNKDMEDAVREKEKMVADFMAKQNEGAKSVLSRMSDGNDSALIQTCWKAWLEFYTEIKKANEMQELMNANADKFGSFNKQNKAGSMTTSQRIAANQDEQVIIIVILMWKMHVKVNLMKQWAKEKNNKKKQQLVGVKGLFKNFANELESGLREGTPRVEEAVIKARREASPGEGLPPVAPA